MSLLLREAAIAEPQSEVDRLLAAHPDIEIVELLLPDTNGVFRGKWVPVAHLPALYGSGMALAKSVFALDAWGRDCYATGLYHEVGDRDGCCRPVPGTLRRVPWAERPTAQLVLRMEDEDGSPFFADPRALLEQVTGRLAARGLTPVVAFELEFYLLDATRTADIAAAAGAAAPGPERTQIYSLADLRAHSALFSEIETAAAALDVPTDTIISEAAPGQFEINLRHVGDPLAAADHALMLRRIVRQVALRHGLRASFMAKPFPDRAGNGMHAHVSLLDRDGRNVFGREGGEVLLGNAVAGLLATMPDAALAFVGTYNGFRRLTAYCAPAKALWAENNRYVAVRLPRGSGEARRFEHRLAGADANPHLVLASILAGVEHGLAGALPAPPPADGDVARATGASLPPTMRHALDCFERSHFIADAFSGRWQHFYAAVKRQELEEFERHVSSLEYETYL